MTERNSGLPPPQDLRPLPEGSQFLTNSVFVAETQRVIYEGDLLYRMARVEGMPENLYAESMKTAMSQARAVRNRMLIMEGQPDIKAIIEELDSVDYSKELSESEAREDPLFPIGYKVGYDIEIGKKTTTETRVSTFEAQERLALIKRFEEARRIALEIGCSVEEIFLFEDSYRLLMQRTTTPREIATEINEYVNRLIAIAFPEEIEGIKTIEIDLDNIDWHNIDLFKEGTIIEDEENRLLDIEKFTRAYIIAAIQRYWGNAASVSFAFSSSQVEAPMV